MKNINKLFALVT